MTERVKLRIESDLPAPTAVGTLRRHEFATSGGRNYGFSTYQAQPVRPPESSSNETMVVLQPFSDGTEREFQQMRLKAIADWTGQDVVGIDNPGVGRTTSQLAPMDAWRLGRGNWGDMTALQWQALEEVLGDDAATTRLTLGYASLGASVAAAMAANAPEWAAGNIDHVVLWDPATPVDIAFGRVAIRWGRHCGDRWQEYIDENPSWMPPASTPLTIAGSIARQPLGHIAYPVAMAATSVAEHLHRANQRDITPHYSVMNNAEGGISPTSENDTLAYYLRRGAGRRAVTRAVYEGETHGALDSLPRTKATLPYWGLDR